MSAERELLKRLVELKDRKDAMATEAIVSRGPTTEALAQYRREKDAAWAEARALLAQPESKYSAFMDAAIASQRIANLEADLAAAKATIGVLAQPEHAPANGRWYDADSIDRLVRDLDVAMNGPDAARQARLCDIMGQLLQRIQAQPERKPMTDEQARAVYTEMIPDATVADAVTFRAIIRATERAHGIK